MKYILLFLIPALCALPGKSQPLDYSCGPKIDNYSNIYFTLFQQDSSNLYAFNYNRSAYFLDIFLKSDLSQTAHIPIPLPSKDSIKFDFENLFVLKDRFLVFYSYFNKSDQAIKLEMLAFDAAGKRMGTIKQLDELPGKNEKRAGTFIITNRPLENKFLSYGYKRNKGYYYLNLDHFDYEGNKLESQDFVIDNSRFLEESFNSGETICRLERDRFNEKTASWFLSFYSSSSSKVQSIDINPAAGSKINIAGKFGSYMENGVLYLLSPYTTGMFAQKARGVYLVTADLKEQRVLNRAVIPFKEEISEGVDSEDFSLASCIITDIIPIKTGLRVLFESRLMTSAYGVPTGYNLGNIVALDIDSNFMLKDINRIYKKQVARPASVRYMGFIPLSHNDATFCIYNELPQNLGRADDKIKNVKSASTDATVVISAALGSAGGQKDILIEKAGKNEITAILPRTGLKDAFRKGCIYALVQKGGDVVLTKIFAP
ncbi:hypothetical protein U0035_04940 [Niabella yanshanensis]|uniref:Uncharacterized protein n=1 Tax=Niabella yanshanensis TaxID=577386 RepID=A0ABZ0WAG8_9BACT|nr:hypothetical protein [Niabella yanshanensis]WQD39492.1 hypothetical protein U0035_04940 [Niabella yanshanensis]